MSRMTIGHQNYFHMVLLKNVFNTKFNIVTFCTMPSTCQCGIILSECKKSVDKNRNNMCICARVENNYYKIYFGLFKRSALKFAFGGKNIADFKTF